MGQHRGALTSDFRRFYGLSPMSGMRDWGIPLSEICDYAANLPPESAVRRSLDPHWQRTPELDMLREMEHELRVLIWQNGSGRAASYPEPMRMPWDPDPDGTVKGERMTFDEMDEFLGWDKLKAERAKG